MKTLNKYLPALVIGFSLSACSTHSGTREPQLYPNDKLRKSNAAEVNQDTRYCMSLADEYVKEPDKFTEALKDATTAAVGGSAAGALTGTILNQGSIGRYVASGAASAAIISILSSLQNSGQRSPSWERFVEQCMDEKGYKIYDWS